MMVQVFSIIVIFLIYVISTIILFSKTSFLKNELIYNYKLILILLGIAILAKFPLFGHYFFGLEYEDAYIYNAFARALLYIQHLPATPFLTQGCLFGSLRNCYLSGTYSGHLITFPAIVYSIFRLIGYSPYTILYINLICSLLSVILIFLIAKILINDNSYAAITAGIFALTPIINVFHTSGLSETFSSTWILLFLYIFLLKYVQRAECRKYTYLFWLSLIFSLTIATLIKRENLLILLTPFIAIFIQSIKARKRILQELFRFTPIIILTGAIILFYLFYIRLNYTVITDQTDIGCLTFDLKFFGSIFPMFLKSFFNLRWFFIFSYSTIIGVCFIFLRIKKYNNFLYPVFFFFSFLLLYSLHYRSYAFVKYGEIHGFETLRYISNLFPFYCFFSGLGLFKIYEKFKPSNLITKPLFFKPFVIIFILLLIFQSQNLKFRFSNIELEERITPVKETLKFANNGIIITNEPLLFQIFGDANVKIIELSCIGKSIQKKDIVKMIKENNVMYLEKFPYESYSKDMRIQPAIDIIKDFIQVSVIKSSTNFQLYQLKLQDNEL